MIYYSAEHSLPGGSGVNQNRMSPAFRPKRRVHGARAVELEGWNDIVSRSAVWLPGLATVEPTVAHSIRNTLILLIGST